VHGDAPLGETQTLKQAAQIRTVVFFGREQRVGLVAVVLCLLLLRPHCRRLPTSSPKRTRHGQLRPPRGSFICSVFLWAFSATT
jgi:hypothetical protein